MSWIHAFELMCYAIITLMLVDLVRKKDYDSLFTFGSAAIDQHTFMSVIWVNFLGYMIETPTVVWLTLRKREKSHL